MKRAYRSVDATRKKGMSTFFRFRIRQNHPKSNIQKGSRKLDETWIFKLLQVLEIGWGPRTQKSCVNRCNWRWRPEHHETPLDTLELLETSKLPTQRVCRNAQVLVLNPRRSARDPWNTMVLSENLNRKLVECLQICPIFNPMQRARCSF